MANYWEKLATTALIITLVLSGCSQVDKRRGETRYEAVAAELEPAVTLKENLTHVGMVEDMAFEGDSAFYVLSDNKVIRYDRDGNQLSVLDKRGPGPEEYINLSLISCRDTSVVVFCNTTLRLLEYSRNGDFIRDLGNVQSGVNQFCLTPVDHERILLYRPGGIDVIASMYDAANGTQTPYDQRLFSEADILTSIAVQKTGIILTDRNELIFAPYAGQGILSLNLTDGRYSELYAGPDDEEFVVEDISDAAHYINGLGEDGIRYVSENGQTKGVYQGKNGLILVSLIGEIKYKGYDASSFEIRSNTRAYRIYFQESKDADSWVARDIPFDYDIGPYFWAHDGVLYTTQVEAKDGDQQITLCRVVAPV